MCNVKPGVGFQKGDTKRDMLYVPGTVAAYSQLLFECILCA